MIPSVICLIRCITFFKLIDLLTNEESFQIQDVIIRVSLSISMNKVIFGEGQRKFKYFKIYEETCGERVEGTAKHYMDNCSLFFADRIELESTISLIYKKPTPKVPTSSWNVWKCS